MDILFSTIGLLFIGPIVLILLFFSLLDTGSPIFAQRRVGYKGNEFVLFKIRSMKITSPNLPTHLVDPVYISAFGSFLRKWKFDELLQLINVLKGEMSLVGPRPSLPNQYELIEYRKLRGILNVKPGITGLAQIRGIDMSDPKSLSEMDEIMINNLSVMNYLKLISETVIHLVK